MLEMKNLQDLHQESIDIGLFVLVPTQAKAASAVVISQTLQIHLKLLMVSELVGMLKTGFFANPQQSCY